MAIELHPIQEGMQLVADKFGEFAKRKLPALISIDGLTPEFVSKFQDQIDNNGVPIIYSNHLSHVDGLVIASVCEDLTGLAQRSGHEGKLRGFALPMAITVINGQQSWLMKLLYPVMEEYASRRGVSLIPVTREKDIEKYGEKPNPWQARSFLEALKRGFGFAVFPGGSVQAGRSTGYGEIFGIQEIPGSDLSDFHKLIEHFGRKNKGQQGFFVPVGISGSHRLFSPDTLFPTPEGLAALSVSQTFIEDLGISPMLRVKAGVGLPITRDDLASALGSNWRSDPAAVNYFLMGQVAALVPDDVRGIYRNSPVLN